MVAFGSFYNWCNEFFNKGQSQKFWPIVVDEINDETLDVGAVLILWKLIQILVNCLHH